MKASFSLCLLCRYKSEFLNTVLIPCLFLFAEVVPTTFGGEGAVV